MSISTTCAFKVFCVSLHSVLCTILIFKDGFEDFTFKYKLILFVINIDMDLTWISLEITNYNSNIKVVLPLIPKFILSLPLIICLPSTYAYTIFVNITNQTKTICKKITNKE